MIVDTAGYTYEFHPAGHIRRVQRGATRLVDAPAAGPWDGVNDPRYGGLGAFGCHLALSVEDPFWQGARHVDSVHRPADPGRDGWGVEPVSLTELDATAHEIVAVSEARTPAGPFARVEHRWRIEGPRASCWFTIRPAADTYVKEPKLGCSSLVGLADELAVLDSQRVTLRTVDLAGFTDPSRRTLQLVQPDRRHVRLAGRNGSVTLTAGDLADTQVQPGVFAAWRRHAETAAHMVGDEGKAYCHCDALRPTWELCRWPDRAGLLLHGWTGGTGFHDCRCAYRRAPAGTVHRVFLRVLFEEPE